MDDRHALIFPPRGLGNVLRRLSVRGLNLPDPCPDLFAGPAVIVVEMRDDLTNEAGAPAGSCPARC